MRAAAATYAIIICCYPSHLLFIITGQHDEMIVITTRVSPFDDGHTRRQYWSFYRHYFTIGHCWPPRRWDSRAKHVCTHITILRARLYHDRYTAKFRSGNDVNDGVTSCHSHFFNTLTGQRRKRASSATQYVAAAESGLHAHAQKRYSGSSGLNTESERHDYFYFSRRQYLSSRGTVMPPPCYCRLLSSEAPAARL